MMPHCSFTHCSVHTNLQLIAVWRRTIKEQHFAVPMYSTAICYCFSVWLKTEGISPLRNWGSKRNTECAKLHWSMALSASMLYALCTTMTIVIVDSGPCRTPHSTKPRAKTWALSQWKKWHDDSEPQKEALAITDHNRLTRRFILFYRQEAWTILSPRPVRAAWLQHYRQESVAMTWFDFHRWVPDLPTMDQNQTIIMLPSS